MLHDRTCVLTKMAKQHWFCAFYKSPLRCVIFVTRVPDFAIANSSFCKGATATSTPPEVSVEGGLRPHAPLKVGLRPHKGRPSADMDPGTQNVPEPRRSWDHSGAVWAPYGFLKNRIFSPPKWTLNGPFGLKLAPDESESTPGPF